MKEERIEKMLKQATLLMSWQSMANLFLEIDYSKTGSEIYKRMFLMAVDFIKSYGSEQDREMLKKVPDLNKTDIARLEAQKRKGVSVSLEGEEAGQATKRWIGEMLKDIGQKLAESE